MVTGYNHTPATLDELISQVHEWDGPIDAVKPVFEKDNFGSDVMPPRIVEVSFFRDEEVVATWRRTSPGWVLVVTGYGRPLAE